MVILHELELKNFKSYYATHKIVFAGNFIGITGPNGSGKSNFLDAIAFAMGAKASDLRVSRMEELAHSAANKHNCMFVKVVLKTMDEAQTSFKRSVVGSSCQHHIDDNLVTLAIYKEELKKLNVNARARNFMVFQDSIELIIMQEPNERTTVFEELCGSGTFKSEYDNLKGQLLQQEKECQYLLVTKRNVTKECRELELCKKEKKEYIQLVKQSLYYRRRSIDSLIVDEQNLKGTVDGLASQRYVNESKLGEIVEDCDRLAREIARIEEICRPKEFKVKKIEDDLMRVRATKEHLEERLNAYRESLESAKKADEARKSNVQELENALTEVRREKDKYFQQYNKTLGRNVQLSASEIKEYEKLKLMVCAACTPTNQRLSVLDREYKGLKDIYDGESTKRNEAQFAIKQKRIERDFLTTRIAKLDNLIREARDTLQTKKLSYDKLSVKLEDSKRVEQNLKEEIGKINEELDEYDELGRTKKNVEIVSNLRENFNGVYKRLGDLCNPIHPRYNVAVIKVLGKNVDAIVVDEQKTALQCIQYLKDNRLGSATFLPLRELKQCRLLEHLRDIRDPPNVKLIYDVIDFAPAKVAKAVFYATENTLICETPEDASKVAYQMATRNNCVSLDGCYYRKSGIISGGNRDLARKAKRWDSQKSRSLKADKENLSAKLREVLKAAPKPSDLSLLAVEIRSIETRLKFTEPDQIKACKELNMIVNELTPLDSNLEAIEKNVGEAKFNMDKAFEAMTELKSASDAIEKAIFAEFCRDIKVDSIQNYENGKRTYEKAMSDFDQQIERIKNRLMYTNASDTLINVKRWEENLDKSKNELELILEREVIEKLSLQKATKELEIFQCEYRNTTKILNETKKKIIQLRDEMSATTRQYNSLKHHLNIIQARIEKKKAQFHADFTEAKVNGLSIIATNEQTLSLSETSDASRSIAETYELEARCEIDFSTLPNELRDLEDSEIKEERKRLENIVADEWKKLDTLVEPDLKASQHLLLAYTRLTEVNMQLDEIKRSIKNTNTAFDVVMNERSNKFVKFFDHVSNRVDAIYKKLTGNPGAQAYLIPANPEEPYLAGIHYDCLVPEKRFQVNENLSGGEKTMAALALLFAIQSTDDKEPPFQILDEIDAALDHKNTMNVLRYIKKKKANQTIVISHKKELFTAADTIIGITAQELTAGDDTRFESRIFTLDLRSYPER